MLKITKPTLLLDKSICIQNIERMSARANAAGLDLRPHCKTHQSHEIAKWLRDFGVAQITVSSFDMAAYFAQSGWKDILVAFPFNPLELNRLIELSHKCKLAILADNAEAIQALRGLENNINVYIDTDIGYGRTGVRSSDLQQIEHLIKASSRIPKLVFSGFYCHAGHSYKSGSRAGLDDIHQKAMSDLSVLKEHFADHNPKILYGDTPNCSVQTFFGDVDEITPGNFVFYDLTQVSIGSCTESDIAVTMVCPVTGKYIDSQQVLIHGGAVHFSKDTLIVDGEPVFGKQVNFTGNGWTSMHEGAYITSISQEHGVVGMKARQMESLRIGDLMAFFPVHSCLTANLMRQYTTPDSEVITMLTGQG